MGSGRSEHIVDEDKCRGGRVEGQEEDNDASCDRRNGLQRVPPRRTVMTRRVFTP